MKKRIALLTALMIALNGFAMEVLAQPDLYTEGTSTLLMETENNQIIYKENEDTRRLPASVTKIMTVATAFDIIEEKNISLDTFVSVSKKAASTKGATIKIFEGEMLTIDSLLSAIIINSANNASVILAEYFAGSEEEFVKLMNKKSQKMDLKDTNFVSCNGLTLSKNHYSTALDISEIALELIEEKDTLRYSSLSEKDIIIYKDPNTPVRRIKLESTNKLLGKYEGVDGLKTGWMGPESGYCFVGTAQEDGTRLLSVSLGAQQKDGNFRDTRKMMDYGFGDFRYFKLLNKGAEAGSIKINGSFRKIKGVLEEDLVIYGNFEPEEYTTEAIFDDLELPVKAGQRIGTLRVYGKGKMVHQVELTCKNDVSKSWLSLLKDKITATFL
ncbi:D-alanyl-D-alanine carboxypeptidase family protein [Proteocatella sphenisci]|uniref:D-alanyl-D-alanine carboxypeptidase family protein n=1 Tax=Proteocatella sphenisci TaxID=181070 RepID=UPI00049064AC|nr:D-alanyl-D-alanine carboxypeptidase family protein [Proteocatella sphenisci]